MQKPLLQAVGQRSFSVDYSKEDRVAIFLITRRANFPNWIHLRVTTLGHKWPFFNTVAGFMEESEIQKMQEEPGKETDDKTLKSDSIFRSAERLRRFEQLYIEKGNRAILFSLKRESSILLRRVVGFWLRLKFGRYHTETDNTVPLGEEPGEGTEESWGKQA